MLAALCFSARSDELALLSFISLAFLLGGDDDLCPVGVAPRMACEGGVWFELEEDDESLEEDELLLDEEDDELLLDEPLLEELLHDELLLEVLPLRRVGATPPRDVLLLGDVAFASACLASPIGPPFSLLCRPGSDLSPSLLESFLSSAGRVFVFSFLGVCPFRFVGKGSFLPVDNASLVILLVVLDCSAATVGCLGILLFLLVVMVDRCCLHVAFPSSS